MTVSTGAIGPNSAGATAAKAAKDPDEAEKPKWNDRPNENGWSKMPQNKKTRSFQKSVLLAEPASSKASFI